MSEEFNKLNIVCFDGVCGICNAYINLLIKKDKTKELRYVSLQDPKIHPFLRKNNIPPENLETIIYVNKGTIYKKSEAVFRILITINYFKVLASFFNFLPKTFTDLAYDFFSNHRYKIFKKKNSCRLPTPEEKDLFL